MKFLTDIKMKIMHAVEHLYGFDTSRAPESISRNATLARGLLTNMAYIYRVCSVYFAIFSALSRVSVQEPNVDGTPRHPYRHPVIQKAINITWFQDKDSDGIVFHEHFTPMPMQVIALTLTVVRF
jgi:hypothetical protein